MQSPGVSCKYRLETHIHRTRISALNAKICLSQVNAAWGQACLLLDALARSSLRQFKQSGLGHDTLRLESLGVTVGKTLLVQGQEGKATDHAVSVQASRHTLFPNWPRREGKQDPANVSPRECRRASSMCLSYIRSPSDTARCAGWCPVAATQPSRPH